MENTFDFSIFYYVTFIILGIGVLSAVFKDQVSQVINKLDEKSNGRSASH